MGNIPAKITGKYQSYDINTPAHVTPAPTLRKGQSPSKSERNEYVDYSDKDKEISIDDYIADNENLQQRNRRSITNENDENNDDDVMNEMNEEKIIELLAEPHTKKWFDEHERSDGHNSDEQQDVTIDESNNDDQINKSTLEELVNDFQLKSRLNEMPIDVSNGSVRSIIIENYQNDFIEDHIEIKENESVPQREQNNVDLIY